MCIRDSAPARAAGVGASSSDGLQRADWENDLDARPFQLRWQQPPRAKPHVGPVEVAVRKDGVAAAQTFEWYELRQMLSFAKLFPDDVCAADSTVCRACVRPDAAGLAEGLPPADDPADCDASGARCLKSGEVPFW